jgi:hypothetical protein
MVEDDYQPLPLGTTSSPFSPVTSSGTELVSLHHHHNSASSVTSGELDYIGGSEGHLFDDHQPSSYDPPRFDSSGAPTASSEQVNHKSESDHKLLSPQRGMLPISLKSSDNDPHTWRLYFVTLATLFLTVTSLSSIFAFSVFISPIRNEHPKWAYDTVSIVLSIQGFLGGIAPFFIGADLQRRGVKFYNVVGICISTAGLILGSISVSLV